jgi:hypothetical protein
VLVTVQIMTIVPDTQGWTWMLQRPIHHPVQHRYDVTGAR